MIFLKASAWKKASERLVEINIGVAGHNQLTVFIKIYELIKKDVKNMDQMKDFIKAMKKLELNPENILKYAVFVQIFLLTTNEINEAKLIEFINFLLSETQTLIHFYNEKYLTVNNQNDNNLMMVNHCSTSTRQDQILVCKQVFLLNCIVKSYISFLLKFIDYFSDYQSLKNKQKIQNHQAWKLINLLKMITGFSRHFTMVGRYFMKTYGYLVVLLAETIQTDIKLFMSLLKHYVTVENCLLSCMSVSGGEQEKAVKQFARILEEISGLNESLIQIYLGKYFYVYLREIPQPDWINTNSSEFDTIFKRWQNIKKDETQSSSSIQKASFPFTISTNSQEKRI